MKVIVTKTTFQQQFSGHALFPVIHLENVEQAVENAQIAMEADADGLFLINHGDMSDAEVPFVKDAIRALYPNCWIGVSFLSYTPQTACKEIPMDVNGLWTDNAYADEESLHRYAKETLEICRKREWKGLYFGGVAFKYQREVEDVTQAAKWAVPYMDVVTTSGNGTGLAAHVDKIRIMKKAIGDFPLAIASGITPENIDDYLPISDAYLVATGICRNDGQGDDFYWFDPEKVLRLVDIIRQFDASVS